MFSPSLAEHLRSTLADIDRAGLYKRERVITTPQGARIAGRDGQEVLNFCANNYLGLADHPRSWPRPTRRSTAGATAWPACASSAAPRTCTSSSRREISEFLGTEDTILYSSCFDANGGLFETLLGAEDAIISDELNHASIIDGIRLCKAQRHRYRNSDMAELEAQPGRGRGGRARFRLIATDGVFSMDGYIANLRGHLRPRGETRRAGDGRRQPRRRLHGPTGRGTPEHCDVMGRVDIITGTLGKALGGASGGFTSGRREIIELLRQRSRPYLFSNTLAPAIAGAPRSGARTALRVPPSCATGSKPTRASSARACPSRLRRSSPAPTRSCRS